MRLTLTVIRGPHEGAEFTFDQYASFVVGRHRKTQFRLRLKDPTLSRFHFLVEIRPQGCAVVDLNSTNHTFVNDEPICTRTGLKDGDVIKAGKSRLRVSIDPGEAAPGPARDPGGEPPCVAGFRVVHELGRGTTGTVYQAFDESRRSLVALKLIAPELARDRLWLRRIEREATIHRQLRQRHIASLFGFDLGGPHPHLVMEYVQGQTALALLQKAAGGRLPVGRAVSLAWQTLDALAYAHRAGVMHRDIKPANLMVTEVDGVDFVKIVDFGLAGFFFDSDLTKLTAANMLMGSVGYMAPEQMVDSGSVDSKADIYAVGATLYALLTAMTPYTLPSAGTNSVEMRVDTAPRPIERLRPDLPQDLVFLIHRALDKDPGSRPDAREMQDALGPWADTPV